MINSNYFYINNIKINNIDKNKNIIDYLEGLKIKIPHFCYHQNLSIAGNCRMCLIELKNSPKPLISCSMTITNKMELYTDSPLVKKARENILEFLLLNHPLDCPVCDQGGECDLQDQSMVFGTSKKRFYKYKNVVIDKNLGPIVKTVMTRCIHCTRCIRFATEIAGVENLGSFGRGANMEIGTYINTEFQSELSGNTIDICPVGALTSKPYSFIDRNWELKIYKTIDFCDGFGSNLTISVKNDNNITKIIPGYDQFDTTNNWISDKSRFSFDSMFSPERISNIYISNGKMETHTLSTWKNIFKEIIFIIYFQDHLNKHLLKKFKLTIIINKGNLSLEVLTSLFLLEKKYSFIQLRKISYSYINLDLEYKFLTNSVNNIKKLNTSNLCFLIGINTRYEGSILNIKLRQRYLKGNFKIFSLNSLLDLTFSTKILGSNLKFLQKMVEGNNFFCQEFIYSKNPLIICSSELFKRKDSIEINEILESLENYITIYNKDWYGFNILNSNINDTGINNISNLKNLSEKDFLNSSTLYFIETCLNTNNTIKKLIELKLLKFIELENNNKFIVEQNSLTFDIFHKKKKNNYNIYTLVQLPSTNFFEEEGIYYNTEGIYKKTVKIISSFQQSKNNWEIIRQFSSFLTKINFASNLTFKYKTMNNFMHFIKFRYFPITNFKSSIYSLIDKKKKDFFFFNKFKILNKKLFKTKTILCINDFYIGGNDLYSKYSKVMIECSKLLRLNSTNFKYIV